MHDKLRRFRLMGTMNRMFQILLVIVLEFMRYKQQA